MITVKNPHHIPDAQLAEAIRFGEKTIHTTRDKIIVLYEYNGNVFVAEERLRNQGKTDDRLHQLHRNTA